MLTPVIDDRDPAASPEGGEPTLAYPDPVETVDGRPPGRRAPEDPPRRASAPPSADRAPPTAGPPGAPPPASGIRIGRYQLLELVGTGGMGLVWGAWDPELERRVAIKLVRGEAGPWQDQMLREGQALARLSHPNVVPIFDVGAVGEQVYLVMEWVRGTTLRAFAEEDPGTRALLDAYRQAARGLEAAHRAGVVHRDFKPDNAIRGDDGRVRVLDFGLARAVDRAAAEPAAGGTPRYMAPEQARGEPATAAVDQYALCTALREALARRGEPPAWVAAIAARGTAHDPAARYPSMGALLAALDRDPARRRARAALGAGALAAAASAFAIGRSGSPGPAAAEAPCTGADAELAVAYAPAHRSAIAARLARLGPSAAAEVPALTADLDAYARGWIGAHRQACVAHERRALTDLLYEARLGCLMRARAQLGAAAELLARADAAELPAALRVARALPDAAACAMTGGAIDPPPAAAAARVRAAAAAVERAVVWAAAGRPDALAVAEAAARAAAATRYEPLIARARFAEGRAAMVHDVKIAQARLDDAWSRALKAGDEPLAIEAFARLLFAASLGEAGGPTLARALAQWPVLDALGERAGARAQFARALLLNNAALPRMGDAPAEARALLERALAVAAPLGAPAGDIELLAIVRNLATLDPDPLRAAARREAALARQRAVLGPRHPEALIAQLQLAATLADRARARDLLEATCRDLRAWEFRAAIAECDYEAAWLADESGDEPAAIAAMARVAAGAGPHAEVASAYVAAARGEPSAAARAAAIAREPAAARGWALRSDLADARIVQARIAERAGDAPAAILAWRRALAILEPLPYALYRRRRARAERALAERLAAARPAEARPLAAAALAWYAHSPADAAIAARLAEIAGSRHPAPAPAAPAALPAPAQ
jgi:hypothetical protein